ncbi:MAG: rod shape-determining protein MreD [Acidimicrobiales bacterium]
MRYLKTAIVVFVLIVLQAALIAKVPLFGARADIVVMAGIAAGIAAGPEAGAFVGFAAGLALDTLLPTPVGMSALCYCVAGYCCGLIQASVLRAAWWIPVATAAIASAASALAFWLLGHVLSQPMPPARDLPTIVIVIAAVSAVCCLPLVRVFRFALVETVPDRFRNDRYHLR